VSRAEEPGAIDTNRRAGVLLVDKPAGPTSHDVVDAVRRALGTRRVGHFGTLDPFATGLLVCGVGPATRLAPFCAAHDKTYAATFRLGWTSTTDDLEGELSERPDSPVPDRERIEAACRVWTGKVDQTPPAYSAKHVAGQRAHALARRGRTVLLEPVPVEIHSITIERYRYPDLDLTVDCGPGTYVRSLARDVGETLGTGAYCAALRRLRSGPFLVGRAVPLDALAESAASEVRSAAEAVPELPRARLDEDQARAVVEGRAVNPPRIPASGWVALVGPRGFIGLGEVVEPEGGLVRPRRIIFPEGEGR
jgi:tRNA pseudouridine55 synthase